MNISYFDDARVTEKLLRQKQKQLLSYRQKLAKYEKENNHTIPESTLYYAKNLELHDTLVNVKKHSKSLRLLILVGIGGPSLGTEAVHAVLDKGAVKLVVLDTISVSRLASLRHELKSYKRANQVAVCVVSKSGATTETLANASLILSDLETKFGQTLYDNVYFIGSAKTDFMATGKKLGANCITMPEVIGGRYSVATAVGLVPLTLLGHDVDEFISGYLDVLSPTLESVVSESAARIAIYQQLKYPHYNFFAFESRLEKLAEWYRQLFGESLGKEKNNQGQTLKHVMVPTIATAVELHSVGQLYMSAVPDVYTDFVSFDDEELDVIIPKQTKVAKNLKGYSLQEVATALYGGVISAYQERQLPYRATVFEEDLAYSVGQFMAMRLREVMYVAELLQVNAFNQPNVELYKDKTRDILFS